MAAIIKSTFPFLPDWKAAKPKVTYEVPGSVHTSKRLKEQRLTPFQEKEVTRKYTATYSTVGSQTNNAIHHTLLEGGTNGSTYYIARFDEPLFADTFDFTGQALFGGDPAIGGPDYYPNDMIWMPDELHDPPFVPLEGATFNQGFQCARFDAKDPHVWEVKKVSGYTVLASGQLLFTLGSSWELNIQPITDQRLYFLDLVTPVSVERRSLSDDQQYYEIVWESVR